MQRRDRFGDGADVPHRLDDVSRPSLAFAADHRGALVDAAQRLAELASTAHEGDFEVVFVHVVLLVGGCEDLALIDVVDTDRLEHLRLDEVPDAALRHDRDGHRLHDPLDHFGIAHARDPTGGTDVGRDALEGHDRHRPSVFGDLRVLRRDDVHDHPAFQHLGEAGLQGPGALGTVVSVG